MWKKIAKENNHEYATACFAEAEMGGIASFLLTILIFGVALLAGYEWMILSIFTIGAYVAGGESLWKDLKHLQKFSLIR